MAERFARSVRPSSDLDGLPALPQRYGEVVNGLFARADLADRKGGTLIRTASFAELAEQGWTHRVFLVRRDAVGLHRLTLWWNQEDFRGNTLAWADYDEPSRCLAWSLACASVLEQLKDLTGHFWRVERILPWTGPVPAPSPWQLALVWRVCEGNLLTLSGTLDDVHRNFLQSPGENGVGTEATALTSMAFPPGLELCWGASWQIGRFQCPGDEVRALMVGDGWLVNKEGPEPMCLVLTLDGVIPRFQFQKQPTGQWILERILTGEQHQTMPGRETSMDESAQSESQAQIKPADIMVDVVIQVRGEALSLEALAALKPGYLVTTDELISQANAEMLVNGKACARGQLVRVGNKLAMQIDAVEPSHAD